MEVEFSPAQEADLVDRARQGDESAMQSLLEPLKQPLFGYVYRMVASRQDAEDICQDVLLRALESISGFRGEARFKTWLFGIATHACLDHLRHKKLWRLEAQLIAAEEVGKDPAAMGQIFAAITQPDFVYEIREHIAFCFTCVGRTLAPEEQAALLLKEVLGFTNSEAAEILGVSEPIFRHSLSAARRTMIESYEGLCQLINKTGRCYQCQSLRQVMPEAAKGPDLVQIEVVPGKTVTPETLFDARLDIVRAARLGKRPTSPLYDLFFESGRNREESRD